MPKLMHMDMEISSGGVEGGVSAPTKISELENDVNYITAEDIPIIPTKISDLDNDSNFITVEDIPKISEIDDTTQSTLTTWSSEKINSELSNKVNISDIPSLEGYVTSGEIEELKNSVADGKASIASALTNQGVTTASDAIFETLATNVNTVASKKYESGKTDGTAAVTVSSITGGVASNAAHPASISVTVTASNEATKTQTLYADASSQYDSGVSSVTLSGVTNNATLSYGTKYTVSASNGKSISFNSPSDRYSTGASSVTVSSVSGGVASNSSYPASISVTATASNGAKKTSTLYADGTSQYNAGVSATKKGTAGAAQVLSGYTFTNSSSVEASGSMTNRGSWSSSDLSPGSRVTIPAGYHNGSGYVSAKSVKEEAPNGMSWTKSSLSYRTNDVTYANGMWVAATGQGLYYSSDGKSWYATNQTGSEFYCVTYGDGYWVAGSYNNGIYYSSNGETWYQSGITTWSFVKICYNSGTWVAISNNSTAVYYSTNGTSWQASNIGGYFPTVKCIDGLWTIGSYGGYLYHSTDGKSWSTAAGIYGQYCTEVEKIGNYWIATTSSGGIYYGGIGSSKTWYQSNLTSGQFDTCYAANGMCIAESYNNGLYYSYTGTNWFKTALTSGNFSKIYNANGIWIAATTSGIVYYSIEGYYWYQIPGAEPRSYVYCIKHDNGIWMMGTSAGLYYSYSFNP